RAGTGRRAHRGARRQPAVLTDTDRNGRTSTAPGGLPGEVGRGGRMPLEGEYAPSTSGWARKQAEEFEATDGAKANTLRGRPIIVLTTRGAKSGKLRKTPLMRVEHDGEYAVVGSKGGAHDHPKWVSN